MLQCPMEEEEDHVLEEVGLEVEVELPCLANPLTR